MWWWHAAPKHGARRCMPRHFKPRPPASTYHHTSYTSYTSGTSTAQAVAPLTRHSHSPNIRHHPTALACSPSRASRARALRCVHVCPNWRRHLWCGRAAGEFSCLLAPLDARSRQLPHAMPATTHQPPYTQVARLACARACFVWRRAKPCLGCTAPQCLCPSVSALVCLP